MSATTPTSANKRPASPSSPDAVTSNKRAREDAEGKPEATQEDQGEEDAAENGNEDESADVKDEKDPKVKMDDTNMDG